MTNEQAIKILKGAIKKPNTKDGYLGQALDMAIKALEQEPCTDAQERYEDLCEYFGDAKDILKSRKDFKAWLERVEWHIHKAEELYEKSEMIFNNLCSSCTNIGCEFQFGIVRTKCAFYMPPHIESDNCGNYDVISRQAVLDIINFEDKWLLDAKGHNANTEIAFSGMKSRIAELPSVTPKPDNKYRKQAKRWKNKWLKSQKSKTGHCKDCKWWKDSDGAFRRGIGAESQCPMNRIEVFEGNGYCFLFEPRESEDE